MQAPIWFLLVTAALASSTGGLLLCVRAWSKKSILAMISAGGGLLLAITVLDLLPHVVARGSYTFMPFVLLGFSLVFFIELMSKSDNKIGSTSVIGVMAGFILHAYVEGMSLVVSMRMESEVAFSVLVGLLLHKVPDGITVASLILVATHSRMKAFWGATVLGIATLVGASSVGLVEQITHADFTPVLLAITAGIFLYVSASHLVPAIKNAGHESTGGYFFGAIVLYLLLFLVLHGNGHHHA